MILSKLMVKLTASDSGFARVMKSSTDRLKRLRAQAAKTGKAMKAFGSKIGMTVAALTGIGIGVKKVFDLGSALEETGSKFATVFGPESAAQVQSFLDGFANKAGLTNVQAQGLVSTTGAIAQGLGFSQKASAGFAQDIVKLSADLSSFNNIPTEEVLMGVNSALTGEREQMKRLGIVIQEADVQAKAFAQTGKTNAKMLTQQEKATATLALITEKAGVAVGDLDRTQGSAANVARRLMAQFKDLRDAIANALMPAFRSFLRTMESNAGKFDELKQKIKDNTGIISAWGSLFLNVLRLVAQSIIRTFNLIVDLGQIVQEVAMILAHFFTGNWDKIPGEITKIGENIGQIWESFKVGLGIVGDIAGNIADIWSGGMEVVETESIAAFQAAANSAMGAGEAISNEIETIEDKIKTIREQLDGFAQSFAKDFLGTLTSAFQGAEVSLTKMLDSMMNRMIEFGVQYAVFKTLLGAFPGSDFLQTMAGSMGFGSLIAPTGAAAGWPHSELANPTMGVFQPSSRGLGSKVGRSSARGNAVINQTINFQVSAIDSRDAAKFIKEQQGTISAVVAEAVNNSSAYRRQLTGM